MVVTNKGPERPITPQDERSEILAALACVDGTVIFDEETPADIIRRVQPDVLVKGADWPAFLGPRHDGSSPETGVTAWPLEGPRRVWQRVRRVGGSEMNNLPIGEGLVPRQTIGDPGAQKIERFDIKNRSSQRRHVVLNQVCEAGKEN